MEFAEWESLPIGARVRSVHDRTQVFEVIASEEVRQDHPILGKLIRKRLWLVSEMVKESSEPLFWEAVA